jgi:hypothetical protein
MSELATCRFRAYQAEWTSVDEQSTWAVCETYKYKFKPTPQQEQVMAFVMRRCRELYNAALQERKEAWQ